MKMEQVEGDTMIDGYSAIRIARAEHDQMIRSLAPVSDDDSWTPARSQEWTPKYLEGLFRGVGNGLSGLRERLKHGRDTALETTLTRPESSEG